MTASRRRVYVFSRSWRARWVGPTLAMGWPMNFSIAYVRSGLLLLLGFSVYLLIQS